MKIIRLLLILLVLSSCSKMIDDFGAKLFLNWHAAYEVILHGKEYFNSDKNIERPFNTWQSLIEIKTLNSEASKEVRQCLVYRVPYQQRLGILKLILLDDGEKCREVYEKKPLAEILNVKVIKFFYGTKKINAIKERKVIPPFVLSLNVDGKWISVPLLNITGKREFKKYSDGRIRSYNRGVLYWPYSENRVDLIKRKVSQQFIGKLSDRYLDRTLKMCEKVSDDCTIVGERKCHRCRFGWFDVLGSKCKTNRIKFCRPNFCGERGEPACIRGNSYLGKQEEFGCVGGSKAGFCKPGLGTYCDGNGILICL